MNYTQNKKIEQVTADTLIIGIDIGSDLNYARAFDWRGMEVAKRVFKFKNTLSGFNSFGEWTNEILEKTGMTQLIIGMEPTGHYWMPFGKYLQVYDINMVFVNPYHVHQIKELDDNSPKKTDYKDPKTIAKLVIDGRYSKPYMPEGIYADLREAVSSRQRIQKELNATVNRIQRWLKIYFPEYLEVYKKFDSKTGVMVLKEAPLPKDMIALGTEGIVKIWRNHKVRAVGEKRAQTLISAAHESIGLPGGPCARAEMQMLLEDYTIKMNQLDKVTEVLEQQVMQVPNAEKLLKIKGIGVVSVAGFLSEVGDVGRFTSPKQIQKLAGLELKENSSGKKKGQTTISKRGRSKLRRMLFQAVLPLIARNEEFTEVYDYYRTRLRNPLKGKQAMVAVECKLIRVFYSILKNGYDYDPVKLRTDIIRPQELKIA